MSDRFFYKPCSALICLGRECVGHSTAITGSATPPSGSALTSEPTQDPDCPSEDCVYCNGSACRQCSGVRTDCEHDVLDRHYQPQLASNANSRIPPAALTSEPTPFKTLDELEAALNTPMSDGAWIPRLVATARAFLSRSGPAEGPLGTDFAEALQRGASALDIDALRDEDKGYTDVAQRSREAAAILRAAAVLQRAPVPQNDDAEKESTEFNTIVAPISLSAPSVLEKLHEALTEAEGDHMRSRHKQDALDFIANRLRSALDAAVLQRAPALSTQPANER
jgi:hypothetical protein